jgi:exonuclease SbcC
MWKVRKAIATNLMTFDDLEFTVTDGVVTVIYGHNKDRAQDKDKSNGSGKSAYMEVIPIGITGSPLRKVKNGEMVQNGKKSCTIELHLENEQIKETMRIERIFYPKKSSQVMIFLNDVPQNDLVSTPDANKFIEEKLGINGDDLFNYFLLSRSRFKGFLDSSDTEKKDTINRFSNGYMVDEAIEILDSDIKVEDEQVKIAEAAYNQMFGKVEGIRESIQEALAAEDDSDDEQIADAKEVLSAHEAELVLVEKHLKAQEKLLAKAEAAYEKLKDDKKITTLKEKKAEQKKKSDEYQQEIIKFREELSDVRMEIKETESKINGAIDCPKCKHTFSIVDDKFDVAKAEKLLVDLREDEQAVIQDGKSAKADYEASQEKLTEIQSKIDSIMEARSLANNEVISLSSFVSKSEGAVVKLNTRIEATKSRIKSLSSQEKADTITPLREKLAELEPQLTARQEKLDGAKQLRDQYVEQKDYFRRFKTHLANKSIKTIESLTNDFLELIGADIEISIEGETTLSSGKSRDKISASLYRNGEELGSFHKNSNGEKAEVNLACILTLHKLINLNAGEGKGLDFLVIDEIMDAADAAGLMGMIRGMNKMSMTVLMVSHGALDANYENVVTVVKEKGKSTIKN